MKNLAIIGAGSWGTALGVVLSPRFSQIRLWTYEKDLALRMARLRENDVYLPGFQLPSNITVSTEFEEVLDGAEIVLGVMPSHHARSLYTEMAPYLRSSMILLSATKGIEEGSLLRMSEVIRQIAGARFEPRIAVLSGPTFAREVARGEPAAVVVAANQEKTSEAIQRALSSPTLRLYTSGDLIGVELGAALKNVIAIGAGVCSGLGLGANTMAALITRGLAEIARLAVAMGAQARTLSGLTGLGDLVLTCMGELSRNRTVGLKLARGHNLDEILSSTPMVAEGVRTTYAAVELARKAGVEMPITAQMHAMLAHRKSPRDALRELMERTLKCE